VELTAGKEVCNHLAYLLGANRVAVERDLQPASVGDMFEKPYPRPHWADSREQCAEMNVQLSSQVKTIQALPQPELQDIKPDPSVSLPPLVSASVFGTLETRNNPQGPSRPAYTDLMPPIAPRASKVAQGDYPSSRGVSSQGSFYVKQEPSENLVHSEVLVPVPGSSEFVLASN
jgi:hypothetical protein